MSKSIQHISCRSSRLRTHVVVAIVLVSSVFSPVFAQSSQALPPLDTALLRTAIPSEVSFIEIRQDRRGPEGFPGQLTALGARLTALGVRLDEHWVGVEHLYMRVVLPPGSVGQRSELIAKIEAESLVAQVIASAAANALLRDIDLLDRISATEPIAAGKLRGFRGKRWNFKPDLQAPHTGELIVKYLDEFTANPVQLAAAKDRLRTVHTPFGARTKRSFNLGKHEFDLVELPSVADRGKALRAYLDSPDVEYAEPNYTYELSATPNDPFFGSLWGMTKIQAPSAWDVRTDANSVTVGIIDTGVDYTHPDLAGNMWHNPGEIPGNGLDDDGNGYVDDYYGVAPVYGTGDPYDDHQHGTHVAGTVGAVGNNGIGVTGVAWNVKMMAVKVLDSAGGPFPANTMTFAIGLDYARVNGAGIVNVSLQNYAFSPVVATAIENFRWAGGVFVGAAANTYSDNDVTPNYPASYGFPNQVIVGASDTADNRPSFSNYGRWSVDVFAPGVDVYSTFPVNQNSYATLNGTSMAAPHVTGVLALAKAQFPWETATELADRARFSTDSVSALQNYAMSGGRINAARALGSRPTMHNLSTRCFVNTGGEIAIAGMIISGPNSKRVSFRAQGPSLANYGVPGVLENPQITIFNGSGQVIGSNDDWGSLSQAEQAELVASGNAPAHALESAWVGTLAPGAYTVHLSGVGGGTGVGIIESFALDGATVTRLVNISTRCYVGTGASVAIAGMIVWGDKPRQVYIRALGPTLGLFGVPGALQDTTITLFDEVGNVIASNDDWRDWDGSSSALENRLARNGNAPPDNRESAIVMRLNPGTYTVHLAGKNGATGVGLIEVNEF